jgi:hypothetical protein
MNKFKYNILIALYSCLPCFAESATIRTVNVKSDLLIPIHTSLGYSTILEFQEKPLSSILGDQDAFKLEYVGNSITLKPLFHNAKSNLFVYTSFDRFNFSIITSPPPDTDYVVHISKVSDDQTSSTKPTREMNTSPYLVIPINLKSSKSGFTLKIEEVELAKDTNDPRAASLIKFDLSSTTDSYRFLPASFGLKQAGHFLDLEGIYLERIDTSKNAPPVNGVIAILNQQWKRNDSLTFVFAFEHEVKKKRKSQNIQITFSAIRRSTKKEKSNEKTGLFPIPRK